MPTSSNRPRRAVNQNAPTGQEYLRVSMDKSGRARSTEEQHTEDVAAAEREGITLGEPYVDVDRSASRYARKAREGFDRLIADLEADRFGADYLWLWESSRGSRRVSEWVRLLELLEQRHVRIWVTTHGRGYDPASPRDRRSLLEDAVDSEYESAKTSARIRRSMVSNAEAGRPNGPTPYGYQRRYDPATKALVAQEPHPEHALVVRELLERLVTGHSLHGIAADFEQRGIRNLSGKPFTAQHLRSIAINPAYAGYRTHVPGRRGTRPPAGVAWGTRTQAVWPALVPEQTWLAVQQLLASPERKKYRPGRGMHLLSTIARCDPCGGPLSVRYYRGAGQYRCRVGTCVTVDQAPLDVLAERTMLAFLRDPQASDMLASVAADGDAELEQVRTDLVPLRTQLTEIEAAVVAREMSPRMAGRIEAEVQRQIDVLEARERALVVPHGLVGLMAPGPDVDDRWESAPMATKRTVASILLTSSLLGELRVLRRPWRGPAKAAVEQRVVFWTS